MKKPLNLSGLIFQGHGPNLLHFTCKKGFTFAQYQKRVQRMATHLRPSPHPQWRSSYALIPHWHNLQQIPPARPRVQKISDEVFSYRNIMSRFLALGQQSAYNQPYFWTQGQSAPKGEDDERK